MHNTPSNPNAAIPKIKLNLRSNSPSTPPTQSKPRNTHSNQRTSNLSKSKYNNNDEDGFSSDLTPAEDEDGQEEEDGGGEEEEKEEEVKITPRSLKHQAKVTLKNSEKGKEKDQGVGKKKKSLGRVTPTATGPGGRDRKRMMKIGERERRRARDEKLSFTAPVRSSSS